MSKNKILYGEKMEYTNEFLDEIKAISNLRINFYGYFSKVFSSPPSVDFMGLTETLFPHFEELASYINSEDMNKAIERLKIYINEERVCEGRIEFLNEINRQYTSSYLLGQSSVATSASVYLSPERLVKQSAWQEIMEVYKSRGFKAPADFKEPEDHISIELLYLKKISELTFSLVDNGKLEKITELLIEQKQFINKYLLTWVPEFVKRNNEVSVYAKSMLYPSVSVIMLEFLLYDVGLTDELLEDIRS